MGPLFSMALIAIALVTMFGAMFLALRRSPCTTDALRRAGGFVI